MEDLKQQYVEDEELHQMLEKWQKNELDTRMYSLEMGCYSTSTRSSP